jgi:glutathione S-transferase
MLKLYWNPGTIALASHIALEEAGADYELVRVDFGNNAQRSPEYLAVNPKGRVPVLVTERGVLTETCAILSYIPETHPQAHLLPVDAWDRAQAHAFNAYLASTVHVAHAHGRRGYRWADEEASFADMRRKLPRAMSDAFRPIEDAYLQGPWVMGEQFTVCDGYLFTIADWLERDEVDPRRFPKVLEHRERVRARPAVARAVAAQAV